MSDLILVERRGAVVVLTLNQPERRNALSAELRNRLIETLEDLMSDEDCRAIVLAGEGPAFCAGGDIKTMKTGDPVYSRNRLSALHRLVRLIATGPKPVVAAVEGAAVGGGMSLALACDFVVAGKDARFAAVFGQVGLMADLGLLWSLPQRVGLGRARRLLMLGTPVGGAEAVEIGLADELADSGAALEAACALAAQLTEAAPMALAMTKAALARASASLQDVFDLEIDGQVLLMQTADHAEARSAFQEKRKPTFRGR